MSWKPFWKLDGHCFARMAGSRVRYMKSSDGMLCPVSPQSTSCSQKSQSSNPPRMSRNRAPHSWMSEVRTRVDTGITLLCQMYCTRKKPVIHVPWLHPNSCSRNDVMDAALWVSRYHTAFSSDSGFSQSSPSSKIQYGVVTMSTATWRAGPSPGVPSLHTTVAPSSYTRGHSGCVEWSLTTIQCTGMDRSHSDWAVTRRMSQSGFSTDVITDTRGAACTRWSPSCRGPDPR